MQFGMLFPGQGSQVVGMGADLAAAYSEARKVFDRADAVLGYALSKLCWQGPIETLTETRHAQPALLTHSVAVWHVLRARGIEPAVVSGHSLGEYSALVVAGVLEFEAALRLVRRRGELMFAAGLEEPGAMAAVIGLDAARVETECAAARHLGVCDVANVNAPDQIVISGTVPAVSHAMQRLEESGAKLVKRLNVSGAFHSALMRRPAEELAVDLQACPFADARVPVIPNVTAAPETRGASLRSLLERQIRVPVLWDASMRALRADFPGPLLEVGPGSVLRGLMRRIDRAAECDAVGERAGLESVLAKIATA